MLALLDNEQQFRDLLQQANRANASFYPIDPRGLVVFDEPIYKGVPLTVDAAPVRDWTVGRKPQSSTFNIGKLMDGDLHGLLLASFTLGELQT